MSSAQRLPVIHLTHATLSAFRLDIAPHIKRYLVRAINHALCLTVRGISLFQIGLVCQTEKATTLQVDEVSQTEPTGQRRSDDVLLGLGSSH